MFYPYKGRCFEWQNMLDSAEFYYRKLYQPHLPFSVQCTMAKGLLRVFQKKHIPDSITKYAQYYCDVNDSSIAISDRETTARMTASYKYNSILRQANEKEKEAFQTRLLYGGLAILLLLCLLCLLYRYRRLHEKHEAEQMNYEKNLLALSIKEQENTILRKHEHDNKELIATNEEEIRRLKDLIKDYERLRKSVIPAAPPELNTPVTFRIHQKAAKGCALDNRDWEEIEVACQTAYPGFTEKLHAHGDRLDHTEYQICVLVKMRFMLSEISVFLSITSSVLSHKRKRMNGKLFQKEGSATDFDERIRSL